jgi:hypothetical protein
MSKTIRISSSDISTLFSELSNKQNPTDAFGSARAPASRLRASRIAYEYFNWERVIDHVGAVVLVMRMRLDHAGRVLGAGQQCVLPWLFRCKPVEFPALPSMPTHRV